MQPQLAPRLIRSLFRKLLFRKPEVNTTGVNTTGVPKPVGLGRNLNFDDFAYHAKEQKDFTSTKVAKELKNFTSPEGAKELSHTARLPPPTTLVIREGCRRGLQVRARTV